MDMNKKLMSGDSDDEVDDLPEKGREVFAMPATLTPKKIEGVDEISNATGNTSPKQRCSPKSTPDRKKNIQDVDDDEEEENVNYEEKDDNFNEEEENSEEDDDSYEEESAEEDDDSYEEGNSDEDFDDIFDVEENQKELNQGPDDKPSTKFTTGAFVVLKTDMDFDDNPPVWKIHDELLLQKYLPFEQDGKVLYKNTKVYTSWSSTVKDKYYDAPILFVQQTQKEHIIEFLKSEIKKDPKSEDAEGGVIESEKETK